MPASPADPCAPATSDVRTVDAPPEPTPDARSAATPGPSRAWRDAVTPRRALVAVCLVFVGLSLVVALATPWGEAHDEADHVLNAATIASGSMYRMAPGVQLEAFQPPLYYIGLAAELDLIGANVHRGDFVLSGRPPTVFRHDLATDGSSQRLFDMLRLPSILLGLATILLTAATARRVSKDRWTPVVAAAVVALIPKFVFLSGVVNNDNLSITLGAAATLLAVVLVSDGLSPRRQLAAATGLGVLAGMMAITKFSTLPLLAAWVVTLVLAPLRSRLASFGLFIVGFLVTSGWWFVWNTDVYGDPLASKATQEHLKRFNFLPLTGAMTAHRAFVEVPKAIWFQFFYSSGSNQFRWSNWWYVPFWIVLAVGLVGLALRLPRVGRRALAVLAVISVFSLATVWIAVIDTTSIQARHAFAGLTAIGVLAALGFERLRLPLLARFVLPAMGFVGILVALHQDVFGVFWS